MKKLCIIALCAALVAPLAAQAAKAPDAAKVPAAQTPSADNKADVSYSLGMLLGANIKSTGLDLDPAAFLEGIKAIVNGASPKFSEADAQAALQTALKAAQGKKSADNLAAGKAFLASNLKKAGVKATASGLQYEVLTLGKGQKPAASDTVTVNYEGKLIGGKVFDSSIARNEPATFPLSGVIPGWSEAVQLMPVGSKFRFAVPSELAYGDQGAGDVIEPNSVLVFEIELLAIEPPAPAEGDAAAPADAAPAPAPADGAKK
jgi:FKBP-type peptidyl-prolyl cis-trans isomerase